MDKSCDPVDNLSRQRRAWLTPLAIGCAVGLLTFLAASNRVIPSPDEGTFLQSGANIFRGAVPYRDFFVNTGPGSFWILAAIFHIAGLTLRSARIVLAFDVSVTIGVTYWLVSRLAKPTTALGASLLCAALLLSTPNKLGNNHRWESGAAELAAIAMALAVIQSPRRATAFLAGAFSVAAAWITPPAGLVGVVIALRFWAEGRTRRVALFHAAGVAVCGIVPAGVLALQGGLIPMLHALLWNASNYSNANRVSYGFFFGGPAALFGGVHGVAWIQRSLFAVPMLLPALLPPLLLIVWLPALRKPPRPEVFLLACCGAVLGSVYPRWDLPHLQYIVPVFLVMAAIWMDRVQSPITRLGVLALVLIPGGAMCAHSVLGDGDEIAIESPVGRLSVSRPDAPPIRMVLANVHPGDSFFVFPYEPLYYFLSGGSNPSRYLWLQPGMMNAEDEGTALSELKAKPPEWILYRDLPAEAYLRVWPGSDPARLRMTSIEEWIHASYGTFASAPSPGGPYELLRRR